MCKPIEQKSQNKPRGAQGRARARYGIRSNFEVLPKQKTKSTQKPSAKGERSFFLLSYSENTTAPAIRRKSVQK